MRGELFVTGSISPTIVLNNTIANNRLTPEQKRENWSEGQLGGLYVRTQSQLLSRVWRQREAEDRHGSDEEARHDQVEEIVESSPPDFDNVGDVKVGLGATVVDNLVSLGRNP